MGWLAALSLGGLEGLDFSSPTSVLGVIVRVVWSLGLVLSLPAAWGQKGQHTFTVTATWCMAAPQALATLHEDG